jgi:hypothetical protein
MTEPLNREEVIDLLQKLGSEQDSEVLEAARRVHARVTGAGLGWEELLVGDEPAQEPAPEPEAEPEAEPEEEPAEEPESEPEAEPAEEPKSEPGHDTGYDDEKDGTPAEMAEKNAASLALIGKLLAKSDISDSFREELDEYKKDIAAGDFMEADRRYVAALHKRLKKRS